jgi:YHS domain-containing protein
MQFRELSEMMEILHMAIAREEAEEAFFRRSAGASTSEVAKNLFAEIADDLEAYRKGLEARRDKLTDALEDLKKTRDPVCGMKVDITRAKHVSMYGNKKYYFCSEACKKAFDIAPEKYTDK